MDTMSGYSRSFRGHCASALTHPVTVAAVVVLLLNDALFKALWPDAWITGKLSDLAWVVFASPLLAFVLSLLLGRRRFGRRTAILVSYVGLPALYAAFNTFEPVHDRILWGLSLVAGGTAGSPLDPTDSLVIPFGLGIAVWVWRRRPVSPDRLRVRLALLAAGVATFASVATSYAWDIGIRSLGIAETGLIVASASDDEDFFQYGSEDGGLTWIPDYRDANIRWGGSEVETPRGKFMIQDSDIVVRTFDGEWTVVYSAAYLQQEANLWIQDVATKRFGMREIARLPYSIVYDEGSGNLVVAMGLQGVLVGTPDGGWSRVAVGDYVPTDFSSAGKAFALLTSISLWITAICLSLSMIAISLVLVQYQRKSLPLGIGMAMATLALWTVLPVLLFALTSLEALAIALVALPVGTILLAIRLASKSEESTVAKGFALGMGIISAIATAAVLLTFGRPGVGMIPLESFSPPAAAILFAIAAITVSWRRPSHRAAIRTGCAGMVGLIVLVFLIWVQLGFGLTFAKISAFVLVAMVAIALTRHIRREQQPAEDTDQAKSSC